MYSFQGARAAPAAAPDYSAFTAAGPSAKAAAEGGSYSRKEKSLGLLCENVMLFCASAANASTDGIISLDAVAATLGVERRRIYDVTNILEALDMVSRKTKNAYIWHGTTHIAHTIKTLRDSALEDAGQQHLIVPDSALRAQYALKPVAPQASNTPTGSAGSSSSSSSSSSSASSPTAAGAGANAPPIPVSFFGNLGSQPTHGTASTLVRVAHTTAAQLMAGANGNGADGAGGGAGGNRRGRPEDLLSSSSSSLSSTSAICSPLYERNVYSQTFPDPLYSYLSAPPHWLYPLGALDPVNIHSGHPGSASASSAAAMNVRRQQQVFQILTSALLGNVQGAKEAAAYAAQLARNPALQTALAATKLGLGHAPGLGSGQSVLTPTSAGSLIAAADGGSVPLDLGFVFRNSPDWRWKVALLANTVGLASSNIAIQPATLGQPLPTLSPAGDAPWHLCASHRHLISPSSGIYTFGPSAPSPPPEVANNSEMVVNARGYLDATGCPTGLPAGLSSTSIAQLRAPTTHYDPYPEAYLYNQLQLEAISPSPPIGAVVTPAGTLISSSGNAPGQQGVTTSASGELSRDRLTCPKLLHPSWVPDEVKLEWLLEDQALVNACRGNSVANGQDPNILLPPESKAGQVISVSASAGGTPGLTPASEGVPVLRSLPLISEILALGVSLANNPTLAAAIQHVGSQAQAAAANQAYSALAQAISQGAVPAAAQYHNPQVLGPLPAAAYTSGTAGLVAALNMIERANSGGEVPYDVAMAAANANPGAALATANTVAVAPAANGRAARASMGAAGNASRRLSGGAGAANNASTLFFNAVAESGLGGGGESKASRRDRSLGVLTQRFIKLFLLDRKVLTLDYAIPLVITEELDGDEIEGEDDGSGAPGSKGKSREQLAKMKGRRLYDIANVLVSVGLLDRVVVKRGSAKRPAFRWRGPAYVAPLPGAMLPLWVAQKRLPTIAEAAAVRYGLATTHGLATGVGHAFSPGAVPSFPLLTSTASSSSGGGQLTSRSNNSNANSARNSTNNNNNNLLEDEPLDEDYYPGGAADNKKRAGSKGGRASGVGAGGGGRRSSSNGPSSYALSAPGDDDDSESANVFNGAEDDGSSRNEYERKYQSSRAAAGRGAANARSGRNTATASSSSASASATAATATTLNGLLAAMDAAGRTSTHASSNSDGTNSGANTARSVNYFPLPSPNTLASGAPLIIPPQHQGELPAEDLEDSTEEDPNGNNINNNNNNNNRANTSSSSADARRGVRFGAGAAGGGTNDSGNNQMWGLDAIAGLQSSPGLFAPPSSSSSSSSSSAYTAMMQLPPMLPFSVHAASMATPLQDAAARRRSAGAAMNLNNSSDNSIGNVANSVVNSLFAGGAGLGFGGLLGQSANNSANKEALTPFLMNQHNVDAAAAAAANAIPTMMPPHMMLGTGGFGGGFGSLMLGSTMGASLTTGQLNPPPNRTRSRAAGLGVQFEEEGGANSNNAGAGSDAAAPTTTTTNAAAAAMAAVTASSNANAELKSPAKPQAAPGAAVAAVAPDGTTSEIAEFLSDLSGSAAGSGSSGGASSAGATKGGAQQAVGTKRRRSSISDNNNAGAAAAADGDAAGDKAAAAPANGAKRQKADTNADDGGIEGVEPIAAVAPATPAANISMGAGLLPAGLGLGGLYTGGNMFMPPQMTANGNNNGAAGARAPNAGPNAAAMAMMLPTPAAAAPPASSALASLPLAGLPPEAATQMLMMQQMLMTQAYAMQQMQLQLQQHQQQAAMAITMATHNAAAIAAAAAAVTGDAASGRSRASAASAGSARFGMAGQGFDASASDSATSRSTGSSNALLSPSLFFAGPPAAVAAPAGNAPASAHQTVAGDTSGAASQAQAAAAANDDGDEEDQGAAGKRAGAARSKAFARVGPTGTLALGEEMLVAGHAKTPAASQPLLGGPHLMMTMMAPTAAGKAAGHSVPELPSPLPPVPAALAVPRGPDGAPIVADDGEHDGQSNASSNSTSSKRPTRASLAAAAAASAASKTR